MKSVLIKLLIGLSVLMNIAVAYIVIGLANGQLPEFLLKTMVEPNYQRWVSQFDVLPVQPGDVVFLGDSITEGGSWHELFPDTSVRNRGIGGDTTSGVLARLHQISEGKPSKVLLLIGTNDLAIGKSDETIIENILTIIDRLKTESPETQVILQSILPRSDGYQARIESLNDKLRTAAEGRALWVDVYSGMLAEDGSISDRYSNDELHLYGEAYKLWADTIADHVTVEK
ncbi:GDSL-type esterase/lipase family protein [Gammaproteobacteria bacterium]|nr:GDSL-type esterase/lipase family protein [Gammaproteobacteria bacterium]